MKHKKGNTRKHVTLMSPLKRRWPYILFKNSLQKCRSKRIEGYFLWSWVLINTKPMIVNTTISISKSDMLVLSRSNNYNHRHHPFIKRLATIYPTCSLLHITIITTINKKSVPKHWLKLIYIYRTKNMSRNYNQRLV